MARFLVLSVSTILISLSISLWNFINIFNIKSIIADQTNTITGTLLSFAGCASSSGVVTSCTNNLLTGVSIVSVVLLAAGGTTILAFGNTYLVQGLLIAFIPTIMTLYDTITMILDVFYLGGLAPYIGGFFTTVFAIAFVTTLMTVQGKVYLGP